MGHFSIVVILSNYLVYLKLTKMSEILVSGRKRFLIQTLKLTYRGSQSPNKEKNNSCLNQNKDFLTKYQIWAI